MKMFNRTVNCCFPLSCRKQARLSKTATVRKSDCKCTEKQVDFQSMAACCPPSFLSNICPSNKGEKAQKVILKEEKRPSTKAKSIQLFLNSHTQKCCEKRGAGLKSELFKYWDNGARFQTGSLRTVHCRDAPIRFLVPITDH